MRNPKPAVQLCWGMELSLFSTENPLSDVHWGSRLQLKDDPFLAFNCLYFGCCLSASLSCDDSGCFLIYFSCLRDHIQWWVNKLHLLKAMHLFASYLGPDLSTEDSKSMGMYFPIILEAPGGPGAVDASGYW